MILRKLLTALALSLLFFGSGCLKTRSEVSGQDQSRVANQKQAENQKEAEKNIEKVVEKEIDQNELTRQLIGRIEVLEAQLVQLRAEKQEAPPPVVAPNPMDVQKLQALQEAVIKLESQMQKLEAEKQAVQVQASAKAQAVEEELKNQAKFTPYQIGEAHFKNKEWKKAILSYQKYSEEFPKGKFVADSKYKIGVSFQELGLKDEAIAFYEEVVAQFPTTETGKKAKFRLSQIKKK
jgi:TolA-binding protein